MIVLMVAAAVAAASPAPLASPGRAGQSPAPALPSPASVVALPYPAYGSPQPQVIKTRAAAGVPRIITLDEATSIAVARVPSLAAARAQVALEDASLDLTRTSLRPDLSASATAEHYFFQNGSSAGGLVGFDASGQSNAASISLSQLIYDGGQVRARIDAAGLTRDATLATYRRDAQTVAYQVAEAYYTVLADERTVAVDQQLLDQDVVSERLVRAQIHAGTEAGADFASQSATTANARTTLVKAQGTFENDRVTFATTLGLDADIDVLPSDDTQGLETATPDTPLPAYEGALSIAYVERPDYEEAKLTIRSDQASLRAAQRGLSPTLSFAGNKSLSSSNVGGGAYLNSANVALDIKIPLYDQGVTRANVASSRASVAIAAANADTTKLTVQQDVRQALIAIVSDRATLDQTRAAYAAAVVSLRSTQGQYRVGVSTLPALIQAEATLASAATNIVNAIYTLRLAQSNLRYALGTILQ
jgi:outer membrane protein TolC